LLALAALALTLAACSSASKPASPPGDDSDLTPTHGGNFFGNPGLEHGREPWFSLKEPQFIRSTERAHLGEASALLRMRDGPDTQGTKVYYLVQEVRPARFPETVSGYYRVENWRRCTPKQYLQFVVIVFGAENLPGDYTNHQIRYLLAGISDEPFLISNAHFVFLTRDKPVADQWVPFTVDVGDDFRRLWGAIPEQYENIRVLFEVRWDDKVPGETCEADVYYDDLYIGPGGGASSQETDSPA
jgi:hypothetical protein